MPRATTFRVIPRVRPPRTAAPRARIERRLTGLRTVYAGLNSSNGIAGPDRAALHDASVETAHPMRPADRGVDPAQGLATESRAELGAACVRRLADLDDGRPDRQPAAGGQRLQAQVEIDVELIAGQRPALAVGLDRLQDPRADYGQLGIEIGRPVRRGSAAA